MNYNTLFCVIRIFCFFANANLSGGSTLQQFLPDDNNNNKQKCAVPIIREYDLLQLFQWPLNKRDELDNVDWFSTPGQILKARLEFTQLAAKRLFDDETWKSEQGAPHLPHLKSYFQQLLFEGWLTVIHNDSEIESIDQLISNIFEYMHPMYKFRLVRQEPIMTDAIRLSMTVFSENLDTLRLVLISFLHNKSHHYRDLELKAVRQNFHSTVGSYRRLLLPVTPQTRRIELMIQATCELAQWTAQLYTQSRKVCYSNVQIALASRLRERLHTIKEALLRIETEENMEEFSNLVSKVHELVVYFYTLDFPSNDFTNIILEQFRVIFYRIESFGFAGPETPAILPFERIRSSVMRTKLESAHNYLRQMDRKNAFTPEMYWKLLQVKVDIRNWLFEIDGWKKENTTETKNLRLLCHEGIKEVNRLKRTMDRLPIPEVL